MAWKWTVIEGHEYGHGHRQIRHAHGHDSKRQWQVRGYGMARTGQRWARAGLGHIFIEMDVDNGRDNCVGKGHCAVARTWADTFSVARTGAGTCAVK